jgi:ubiquinone/menaquinone biosynthesis C-methylase UbiE
MLSRYDRPVRTWLLAFVCVLACSRAHPAPREEAPVAKVEATVPQVDPPGYYLGRKMAEPMSYLGADWLERANRDEQQRPEHVLDVLKVHEGQTVADVGCGSGYFTSHLSRRVGPRGHVYATDLQPQMLDLLAKRTASEHLDNVVPVLAQPNDAKLPEGKLDVVLLVDVYHELPNPPVTLAQFKKALAPAGVLALVEYRAEDPKVEIKPEHKTTLEQLKKELTANRWRFLASDESLPQQRIVTFRPE